MTWKTAEPRCVVQMIPVDKRGRVLMMHRGPNVRSARNVWSFPTGLWEIGDTMSANATRELEEEYGLLATKNSLIGLYENIAGDQDATEQYHWVIALVSSLVADVTAAVNREPDKHDKMQVLTLTELVSLDFDQYPFHPSFMAWFTPQNRSKTICHIYQEIQ